MITTILIIFLGCAFVIIVAYMLLVAITKVSESDEDPIEAEYRVESVRGELE